MNESSTMSQLRPKNQLLYKNKHIGSEETQPVDLALEATAELEELPENFQSLKCISIHFPLFTDGRGYSLARLLREAGFQNELRATGDILIDQLYYLKRCGFDSFLLREDQSLEVAKEHFETFSRPYQMAADHYSAALQN